MVTKGACPRCRSALDSDSACSACGLAYSIADGVVDVLGPAPRPGAAGEVERFYGRSPFPGYAPADDAGSLLDRSRRAPFLAALDAALPSDAAVLDVGAGTAQLAAFLALAGPRRSVFAVDACAASLREAARFRARTGIPNLSLVRADLFDLPVRAASFACVLSRGVVHHTSAPREAIAAVARCVAPAGTLVLGFYESWARLFHCARVAVARVAGRPLDVLDPLLRARSLDPEKRRIWIEDQYHHPLEHRLALPAVWRDLHALGFDWVRTVPPLDGHGDGLLHASPLPGWAGLTALRLGWALRGVSDPDAGLVCLIARRTGDPRARP